MHWNDWLGISFIALGSWMFGVKTGAKWQKDIEFREWRRRRNENNTDTESVKPTR